MNRAIKLVCEKGLTDILKLLLDFPKVDPTVLDNLPLLLTKDFVRLDTMQVLLDDGRVDLVETIKC
jgi:hypothetical protein